MSDGELQRYYDDKHRAYVAEGAADTLYPEADSWYVGANVPGKPRVFMAFVEGLSIYADISNRIAAEGYEGFRLEGAGVGAA